MTKFSDLVDKKAKAYLFDHPQMSYAEAILKIKDSEPELFKSYLRADDSEPSHNYSADFDEEVKVYIYDHPGLSYQDAVEEVKKLKPELFKNYLKA